MRVEREQFVVLALGAVSNLTPPTAISLDLIR